MTAQETEQPPEDDPNRLLANVLGSLPGTTIIAFDRQLRLLLLAGGEMGGMEATPGGAIGKRLHDLVPAALFVRIEPHLQSALAGESRADEVSFDERTWWIRSQPLRTSSGKVYGGVGIATDVTDRRVEEIRRLRLDVQLERGRRLEAVGKLAGGIAHDFNNLLAVVLNYADFVTDALPDDSLARADMREIKQAAERGAALTRQLLIFSRRESSHPRVISLNKVVRELEKLLRRTLGADIDLEIKLDDDLASIRADPGQLEQALAGLAINAREAMPDGGTLRVETTNCTLDEAFSEAHPESIEGEYARVSMADTGAGIGPAQMERIFEPFFTTKSNSETGGLGLAAAHGIVSSAGGYIDVRSELGSGTTFDLYFPRWRGESDAAPDPEEAAIPGRTASILVVEDDDYVRRMAVRVLEVAGHVVTACANGKEAIAMLNGRGDDFDLVLTDVVMPEASGIEVAKHAAAARPDLPVLLMSGYAEDVIPSREIYELSLSLLRKPFTARELLDLVHRELRPTADAG